MVGGDGQRSPTLDQLLDEVPFIRPVTIRENISCSRGSTGERRVINIMTVALQLGSKIVDGHALPFQPLLLWCREIDFDKVFDTRAVPYGLFLDMTDMEAWFPSSLQPEKPAFRPKAIPPEPLTQQTTSPIQVEDPVWIRAILLSLKNRDSLPNNPTTCRSVLDLLVDQHMKENFGGPHARRPRVFAAYLAHLGQSMQRDTAERLNRLRSRPVNPFTLPPVLSSLVDQVLLSTAMEDLHSPLEQDQVTEPNWPT